MKYKATYNFSSLVLLFLAVLFTIVSCKKAMEMPDKVDPVSENSVLFNPPSYFPEPLYDFSQNPLTKEKVDLGKMLFYDPILSGDSTIACSNCHQPFAAFSHLSHAISHGIDRKTGIRNTPGLYNLAWMPNFMLDGGIVHLDVQPLAPINNPVEMGSNLADALKALNKNADYRKKFKEAWNVDEIGSEQMLKSLSQFMLTIVSCNSKYDKFLQGKAELTGEELEGLTIVKQKCAPCHGGELFTDFSIRNIGMDSTAGDITDLGKETITRLETDRRKFRVPSLRNFELTGPYMHNGITSSFNGVMARHDTLVQDVPNLDPIMITNGIPGIRLTRNERDKIYVFLLTLTDNTISTNPAFLTPFDHYAPDH